MALTTTIIVSIFGFVIYRKKKVFPRGNKISEEERIYNEKLGIYQDTIEKQFPEVDISKVWGTKRAKEDVSND